MFEDNGNKCGKCQNHEYEVLKKGHARDCPFKKCDCQRCRLLDARSDILQVISGKETKLKGTKKDPNCGFCQNHGIKILRKGHVRSCGFGQERHFRLDNCFDCEVHYIRNEVNRLQIKMRRAMKEDRMLSEEQRKTAREPITRDEVEKVCDMARLARKKRETMLTAQQVASQQLEAAASTTTGESSIGANAMPHSVSNPSMCAASSTSSSTRHAPTNPRKRRRVTIKGEHTKFAIAREPDEELPHPLLMVQERTSESNSTCGSSGNPGAVWRPWSQQQQQIVAALAAHQQQQQQQQQQHQQQNQQHEQQQQQMPQRIISDELSEQCDSANGYSCVPMVNASLNSYLNHLSNPMPPTSVQQADCSQQQQQPIDMQCNQPPLADNPTQQFASLVNSTAAMLQSNYMLNSIQQEPQAENANSLSVIPAKSEPERQDMVVTTFDSDSSRNSSLFSELPVVAVDTEDNRIRPCSPPPRSLTPVVVSESHSLNFFGSLYTSVGANGRVRSNAQPLSLPIPLQQRTPQEQQYILSIVFRVLLDNLHQQQQQQLFNQQ